MKIFEHTLNTRPLLPNSLRYIRSDVPTKLSEQECLWLLSNNITTIVDLRSDDERLAKVCPLINDGRFSYHCMPVTGGNAIPASKNEVTASYIKMYDDTLKNTISFITASTTNILYFCNAGKDRTGVVSAILLHNAGFSPDYIIDDYMKSKENLKDMLKTFTLENPHIDPDIITPCREYIMGFLRWVSV